MSKYLKKSERYGSPRLILGVSFTKCSRSRRSCGVIRPSGRAIDRGGTRNQYVVLMSLKYITSYLMRFFSVDTIGFLYASRQSFVGLKRENGFESNSWPFQTAFELDRIECL
ncbi:unnamed protein product [Albugo candida]|uniref:Uncharacterized protein n=1 Tax=Albugo candida TaxID=65357 RepID=A0A024GNV9_9STRA|nr:unnamed protein product [Albugo candida]|eukprot:CCI48456.1 unnamed protein product [Albugo candida]